MPQTQALKQAMGYQADYSNNAMHQDTFIKTLSSAPILVSDLNARFLAYCFIDRSG